MTTTPRTRKPRARPVLIVDWRRAWRMLSVQAAALACTIGLLPPDQQTALLAAIGVPPERLPLALGLLFLGARLLNQPAVSNTGQALPGPAGEGATPPAQAGQEGRL